MESNHRYLSILETVVRDYYNWANQAAYLTNTTDDTDENCLIVDLDRGYCLWVRIGWDNGKRIEKIVIFARIKNHKIWIETDWTNDGIATDLMRAGIPNTDIVLGFLDPEERSLSEFAIA
jgi:hypothetical protein